MKAFVVSVIMYWQNCNRSERTQARTHTYKHTQHWTVHSSARDLFVATFLCIHFYSCQNHDTASQCVLTISVFPVDQATHSVLFAAIENETKEESKKNFGKMDYFDDELGDLQSILENIHLKNELPGDDSIPSQLARSE